MTRNTQASSATANKIFKHALEKIMGPGVQKRIERAAALPDKFPGNDGIFYDPNWQDDVIDARPTKKSKNSAFYGGQAGSHLYF
jgi:hypothetical protein